MSGCWGFGMLRQDARATPAAIQSQCPTSTHKSTVWMAPKSALQHSGEAGASSEHRLVRLVRLLDVLPQAQHSIDTQPLGQAGGRKLLPAHCGQSLVEGSCRGGGGRKTA